MKQGAGIILITGQAIWLNLRKAGAFSGKYQNPGGLVEEGELPIHAAIREVKEEAGLDLAIERCRYLCSRCYTYEDGTPFMYHSYVVQLEEGEVPVNQEEKAEDFQLLSRAAVAELPLMKSTRDTLHLLDLINYL